MTQNYNEVELIKSDHQFQFHIDGLVSFIDYGQVGNDLMLIHTEVPGELEGRGIAAALVERTLAYAEASGLKVVPRCAYIVAYLKKHPEWNRIVDTTR
ncbi:MAG: N-acetyltransferase [Chitinophagaceae bacterium]|nr:N-acetyltransferase [Chitinophagaceae bacterium]